MNDISYNHSLTRDTIIDFYRYVAVECLYALHVEHSSQPFASNNLFIFSLTALRNPPTDSLFIWYLLLVQDGYNGKKHVSKCSLKLLSRKNCTIIYFKLFGYHLYLCFSHHKQNHKSRLQKKRIFACCSFSKAKKDVKPCKFLKTI